MEAETKICQNCKKDFVIEPDDFAFYEKIKVPPPTFCPECRLIRKLSRRNERTFYHGICEKCQKKIIQVLPKESGMRVYCAACWHADDWDGLDYSAEFNPKENFFKQLDKLFHTVPNLNLHGLYTTQVNSEYVNMVSWLKNCYMVTYSDFCENITYGSFVNHSRDSVDNLMGHKIELCYETVNCSKCYKTLYSADCENCNDIMFCKNCVGCSNCFGCANLKNKNYYFFNKPYNKDEYQKKIIDYFPLTSQKINDLVRKSEEEWKKFPQKYMHGWRNVHSSGDYINNTKNAQHCFIGFDLEDCKYCYFLTGKLTDSHDFVNFGLNSTRLYETLQAGDQVANVKFSQWVISNCHDIEYSFFCESSQNLFGCVGLKKRQYCILNKQYSKEEYFKLREKIIKHMNENPHIDKTGNVYKYGEFFPIETSPVAYNTTTAQEFFPLTKEEALAKGYFWKDSENRDYRFDLKNEDIPNSSEEISKDYIGKIFECANRNSSEEQCTEVFKIVEAEINFYKKMGLPLPKYCPNCRHYKRLKRRNPLRLWKRQCMKEGCNNEFETSYAPDRPEIIYCEKCYNSEVV